MINAVCKTSLNELIFMLELRYPDVFTQYILHGKNKNKGNKLPPDNLPSSRNQKFPRQTFISLRLLLSLFTFVQGPSRNSSIPTLGNTANLWVRKMLCDEYIDKITTTLSFKYWLTFNLQYRKLLAKGDTRRK